MTATTEKPRHKSPASEDHKKQTTASKREGWRATLGAICDEITGLEYKAGGVLIEVLASFPDTASGRKAFYAWASASCGGRKEGMIRRWMTAAKVLHRVPTFKTVSTKLDTLQFVAGLPDDDIAAIAASFEGKAAPTEAAVKKAALKLSETAQKRETRRKEREVKGLASTREKNNAAEEQFVSKWFKSYADDRNTLLVQAETDLEAALTTAYLRGCGYGTKTGVASRVVTKMTAMYLRGEHLTNDDDQ